MEQEDMIRMAREAGWQYADGDDGYTPLWRFAELIEAAVRKIVVAEMVDAGNEACQRAMEFEREECAKLCDEKVAAEYDTGKVDHNEIGWTQSCAAAIRARGQ